MSTKRQSAAASAVTKQSTLSFGSKAKASDVKQATLAFGGKKSASNLEMTEKSNTKPAEPMTSSSIEERGSPSKNKQENS